MNKKLLTTIVVILALGLGSWFVFNQSKSDNNASKSQNQNNAVDPSEGGKYLVIKEWGVRFKLPDEYKDDIYYRIEKTTEHFDGGLEVEIVRLASHTLDSLPGSNCALKTSDRDTISGGLGLALSRSKEKIAQEQNAYIDSNKLLEDKYYYHIAQSHASCGSNDQVSQKQAELINQLIPQLKNSMVVQ